MREEGHDSTEKVTGGAGKDGDSHARTNQLAENIIARYMLEEAKAFATGHFVYKSWFHGPGYINKEKFAMLNIKKLDNILVTMVGNAVILGGVSFKPGKVVTVIGPAYGAIGYAHPVALTLSGYFPETIFRPGRTQLDDKGKHYIPEKLIDNYLDTDILVAVEDVVNKGTTIREINLLFQKILGIGFSTALAIANRGGQTDESMGLLEYHPLFDINMAQFDPRVSEELEEINKLPEINTVLGKGKGWIEMFGRGPYPADRDFSACPFE